MMRFALLCDDPLASPVIDALSDHVGGHQLTFAVLATKRTDNLLHHREAITFVERCEDLPLEREVDAVLVGGADQLILDGAKQLATSGIPILFVPQAGQGSTFAYELSLIRDDNQVSLFPLFWHRYDAAAIELRKVLSEGRLGKIQFLQLNRGLGQSSTNTPLSQPVVDAELLNDADLLRWLIGDYDQVTCLRTASTSDGVMMQSVVLAGRSLPEANWSIAPVTGPDQWWLTVRGDGGVAELHREGSSRCWICEIDGSCVAGDDRGTASRVLDAFASATATRKSSATTPEKIVGSEWGELVKCFETVDATHRSIKRRRTIELHFEPMSERAIFKTQMTAMGCGLLVATFFMTLCFLGIASVVPLPQRVLEVLRILVFAPLIIFLIAQILLPLTRPSSNEQPASK
jgi:myo-inositol 2-dehydrogenase/D-chiro-inositol 1-dehydrogenase